MPLDKHEIVMHRFDRIDKSIDTLFKIIEGNGADGIKGRLIKVEGTVSTQEGRWKWIFRIIAVIVAAMVVSLFTQFT